MAVSRFQRFDDPKQFFTAVSPVLTAREVESGLILGAAAALAETGGPALLTAVMGAA